MSSDSVPPVTIIDALGRKHRFERAPRRVVSLVPSLTETLCDIGAGGSLAGVTSYCIIPPLPPEIPRVGGTKNPDLERIRGIGPELVYVNVEENLPRHARAIETFAPVVATEPKTVEDVAELIRMLGSIHRRENRAEEWVALLAGEVAEARRKGSDFSFVCPIWKDPWMWCGGDTYVSALATVAGGRNLMGQETRYPRRSIEDVVRLDPDVIFLPDEPYAFTEQDAAILAAGGFRSVIGPFAGHLFTWHGTRTVAGLRYLRESAGL
jgi:ABC-type Fe3+-hydroxamate transport system substrate-binding protein